MAREFDLGGIILFARNVEAPDQVAEVSRQAQTLAGELPLWVSVDQEGGRVARLKSGFTLWPPMLTLGRSGDEQLAVRFAAALASELKAVGISLDYTPVLDILTNPKNPVIGDRALAERAEDVARLGRAIITTLQSAGIAACGKHFPGHGDTSTDSHHELPVIEHPPDRIDAVELVPFRAAIQAHVAAIMTAHILIPALDDERPATLSPRIVDGILKRQLGYTGPVFSDDLEMKAIGSTLRRSGSGSGRHWRRLRRRAALRRLAGNTGRHVRGADSRAGGRDAAASNGSKMPSSAIAVRRSASSRRPTRGRSRVPPFERRSAATSTRPWPPKWPDSPSNR